MNKSDFIVRLAGNLDDTQVATKAMLETTLETVAEVLAEGDSVELHGFGKFEVVERNARGAIPRRVRRLTFLLRTLFCFAI